MRSAVGFELRSPLFFCSRGTQIHKTRVRRVYRNMYWRLRGLIYRTHESEKEEGNTVDSDQSREIDGEVQNFKN